MRSRTEMVCRHKTRLLLVHILGPRIRAPQHIEQPGIPPAQPRQPPPFVSWQLENGVKDWTRITGENGKSRDEKIQGRVK